MSAKQAKRLRKAAMGLAVSVSEAGKEITSRTLLAQEHRRATIASTSSVAFDPTHPKDHVDDHRNGQVFAVTAINAPNSLRGIIRTLKKGMRNGTLDKMPPRA